MHDVIGFLKEAVAKSPSAGTQDCYVVDGKMIRANNEWMHAAISWPSKTAFALPADAVDAFLARTESVDEIKVEAKSILLKGGRISTRIDRRFEEPEPLKDMPKKWKTSPPGLTQAIKIASAFIGEGSGGRIWVTAVRLWQDRVTASSGQVMIDITVPKLGLEQPKLLSEKVAAFLVAQGDPDQYGYDDNSIAFRWEDGRWVWFRLVDAEMPEDSVHRIFEELAGKVAPVAIGEGWTDALADAVALSDGTVGVTISGLQAIKKNSKTEISLDVDVDSAHMSYWSAKDLAAVVAVASAWNPGAYPNLAFFKGDGLRGAIVGRQK